MTPRLDQDPLMEIRSACDRVKTGPPATSMRFRLLSAKKPTDLLSGDQNGPYLSQGTRRRAVLLNCRLISLHVAIDFEE